MTGELFHFTNSCHAGFTVNMDTSEQVHKCLCLEASWYSGDSRLFLETLSAEVVLF